MNILTNTRLQFLNIGKYGGMYADTADFSGTPRPFFSIGMILNGTGDFYEKNYGRVSVFPGDIIIVPNAATYISRWTGNPHIEYITFHFILENGFENNIPIQKISGYEHLTKYFCLAYNNFANSEMSFKILSIFYGIVHEIFPKIKKSSAKQLCTSVKKAVDYITLHYTNYITIAELAEMANLSPSRFFTVFKKETGFTPIAYKNHICIRNAKKMLLISDLSIEQIAEKLGFNSSSYFRRTFKAFVGQSPIKYRNSIKTELRI